MPLLTYNISFTFSLKGNNISSIFRYYHCMPFNGYDEYIFRSMMLKARIDDLFPCWPIVFDNDVKTNEESVNEESPMGNATKCESCAARRRQRLCIVQHSGFSPSFKIPASSLHTSFLSCTCRLIRKFCGKERKEGAETRGFVVTLFKTFPLSHQCAPPKLRCYAAKHPIANF